MVWEGARETGPLSRSHCSQMFFRFGLDRRPIHARLYLIILRVLESRHNHFDRSQLPMSIQSIARSASDPLQHVFVDPCRYLDKLRLTPPSSVLRISNLRTPAITDVAAKKLTIRKRPIRDFGASHCSAAFSVLEVSCQPIPVHRPKRSQYIIFDWVSEIVLVPQNRKSGHIFHRIL